MARIPIFVVLVLVFVPTDALPVNIWRPVLEQVLDGCPCKVQLGGMASSTSRVTSEIVPRQEYDTWVRNGRPNRVPKLISFSELPSISNSSEPRLRKPFCFTSITDDDGDHNIIVYSAGDDLQKVDVEDIARKKCPDRSIYDYGDTGDRDECDINKNSGLKYGSVRPLTPTSRILHGHVVLQKEIAAYNVKITDLDEQDHIDVESCSGSLIAPQFVLTAAHCKVKPSGHVHIGAYLDYPGEKHSVTDKIVHKGYKKLTREHSTRVATELHDIQLLRLDSPVKGAEKRMVTLNADCHRPVPCRGGRVSGYGKSADHECESDLLRSSFVNIVGHDECHQLLIDAHEGLVEHCLDKSAHICATHDLCGAGLCHGDSGGPLVIVDRDTREVVQVGISSFIVGDCGARKHPDIYTTVSYYQDWIHQKTNGTARFNPPLGPDRVTDCPVHYESGKCRTDGHGHVFATAGDDGQGGSEVGCNTCGNQNEKSKLGF